MRDDPHNLATTVRPESATADRQAPMRHTLAGRPLSPGAERLITIVVNVTGAAFAVLFARASVEYYLSTHSLVGGLFVIEQSWFAVAFLIRRAPRGVSTGPRTGYSLVAAPSAACSCARTRLTRRGESRQASAFS